MIDIIQIFSDRSLLYMLLAFSGIISLIIFGMIPPIGSAFLKTVLKNQDLAISNTQSRVLAAIGLSAILLGSIGIILEANSSPSIYVSTFPESNVTIGSTNSTTIAIIATASDEDAKSIVKGLFGNKEQLRYEYSYEGPGTNNVPKHFAYTNESVMNLSFYGNDVGTNTITVNVTDRPVGDRKVKRDSGKKSIDVKRHNSQPKIIDDIKPNKASPQPAGSIIMFHVEAVDDDGDDIFYKLKIRRPINLKFEEIEDWTDESDLIWMTDKGDVGENFIYIYVGDKYHKEEDKYKLLTYVIENSR